MNSVDAPVIAFVIEKSCLVMARENSWGISSSVTSSNGDILDSSRLPSTRKQAQTKTYTNTTRTTVSIGTSLGPVQPCYGKTTVRSGTAVEPPPAATTTHPWCTPYR